MQSFEEKIKSLVESYLDAHARGEFDNDPSEQRYHDLVQERQGWLRENILDHEKLTKYTDEEFTKKFDEMFDHIEGGDNIHHRMRGVFKKASGDPLKVRQKFENVVALINDPRTDRFELLATMEGPDSEYNIKGLGSNTLTGLVNAKYDDVPPINDTTKIFFASIGLEFPTGISKQQRTTYDLFKKMIELSDGKIDFIHANHVCWYTRQVDSGIAFMRKNFGATYVEPGERAKVQRRKQNLTLEEQKNDLVAHLQAIHDQAMREA